MRRMKVADCRAGKKRDAAIDSLWKRRELEARSVISAHWLDLYARIFGSERFSNISELMRRDINGHVDARILESIEQQADLLPRPAAVLDQRCTRADQSCDFVDC